ncbi:sensor histidine kinase [Nonomuraea wenchangensis]
MKGRLWNCLYLVVLAWPLPTFLASSPSPGQVALAAAGLAVFVGLYLWVMWCAERSRRAWGLLALALLYVVAAAMTPLLGELWLLSMWFFLIAAVAVSFPERTLPVAAGATILAVTLAFPLLLGLSLAERWWFPLQGVIFAVAMRAFLRLESANRALSQANAEVERLAVDNERLRFARDMHDLLGHSLAVMTVKSQLAARLVTADPERARAEAEEVEELSRQALADVREAITGYRELSLADELDGARRALATAGVRLEVAAAPLPADVEPVLAWVVREGTTNVVRHSGARHCRILLGVRGGEAYAEVSDDGGGCRTDAACAAGNGLRGLAERVEVAGGVLDGGPAEGGGFRLSARLPLTGATA